MTISTHILDTALGHPAPGIPIRLTTPTEILDASTDPDGRHRFTLEAAPAAPTTFTLHFETASYYAKQGLEGLYPHIEIAFTVKPGQTHYHIPLLLTANGYTTYRGS